MAVSQRFYRRAAQVLRAALAAPLLIAPAMTTAAWSENAVAQDWHICAPYEKRITCIVDGDTFWLEGEKMRLLGVDTPEVNGPCATETQLADQATHLLKTLMSTRPVSIEKHGLDRYGRRLVVLYTGGTTIGALLLDAGLAAPYGRGSRADWCR